VYGMSASGNPHAETVGMPAARSPVLRGNCGASKELAAKLKQQCLDRGELGPCRALKPAASIELA
jgi:hypothetical protein